MSVVNTASPPRARSSFVIAPGSLVDGRYRVIERLAQGGMGVIYRAEDVMLQRPAALKVIDPTLAQSREAVDQFGREARALARLRHDNVVQIYAFGASGSSHFFAMELVDGEDLDVVLERCRANATWLSLARILEILQKVASGLTAAHARHVTHRDVKPANIVIERETGRPVLVDFGIARNAADTLVRDVSGTPAYMAPEQIRNDPGLIGDRVDVYALACTAFEMICGRPPFESEALFELMLSHLERPPPLMTSFRPEYEAFDAVFARSLAKNPAYRHESCVAFVQELVEAARAVASPPVTKQVPAVDNDAPRILILAEDDSLRRSLVREATRSLQKVVPGAATVDCVATETDLHVAFDARRPSVVVLDDDCARGTSLAVAQRLRERPNGGETHIVVLTRDMLAARSVWQAVRAHRLSKPLSARALAATLDGLLAAEP